jgi:FkbM family methyltransferase
VIWDPRPKETHPRWTAGAVRAHTAMSASPSQCLVSHSCLNLPLEAPAVGRAAARVPPDQLVRAAAHFRTRPGDYLPSWGGATGYASKAVSAARRYATFFAIVDVGCNTGTWSRQWLKTSSHPPVLCVEALPSLAAETKRTLSRTPGGAGVHVINVALSNASGTKTLYGLPKRSKFAGKQTGAGLSRADSEGAHVELGHVEVQTLDRLLRQWRLFERGRLFVKIDTEGFDVHVLAGAACALKRGAIDILQLEWNRRKLRGAAPPCVTLRRVSLMLEAYGLEAYLVGRPYLPLSHGHWVDLYEAKQLACPPYCTGDVVALRRGMPGHEAIVRELVAEAHLQPRTSSRQSARRSAKGGEILFGPPEPRDMLLRAPPYRLNHTTTAAWAADRR